MNEMNGLKFKAVVEGVGALIALGVLAYLLIMGVEVSESLRLALYALVLLLGAYFGFSAFEHLKRNSNSK